MNIHLFSRRQVHALRLCSGIMSLLLLAPASMAGSFSVSPVRIYMQARERAVAVTVTNEGDTELVLQAELFEWKQKPDGSEDLSATEDIVMAPPVLKVAPKSRQVLRLANLKPVPPGQQLTYRLFVREVPEAIAPVAGTQIQVALAFSIPVFITPPGVKRDLACGLKARTPEAMVIGCENKGQAYAQPVSFALGRDGAEPVLAEDVSGGYILPQMKREFRIKQTTGKSIAPGPAKLTVVQDDGSKQTFDILLAD